MPDDVSSWHNAEVVSPSRLHMFHGRAVAPGRRADEVHVRVYVNVGRRDGLSGRKAFVAAVCVAGWYFLFLARPARWAPAIWDPFVCARGCGGLFVEVRFWKISSSVREGTIFHTARSPTARPAYPQGSTPMAKRRAPPDTAAVLMGVRSSLIAHLGLLDTLV